MPILEFHLAEGRYSDEQVGRLLTEASRCYAQVLQSPIERVRVFAQLYKPQHVAVAGRLLSDGGDAAPYFHFLVLAGRPLEQCHALIAAFTDLCVDVLGAERALVRGGCWPIPPQYWGIAGSAASVTRGQEIAARAAVAVASGAVT